jgi:hypothetical protein
MDGEAVLAAERRLIYLGTWTAPAVRAIAAQAQAQGITVAQYISRWIEQRDLKPGPRYRSSSTTACL